MFKNLSVLFGVFPYCKRKFVNRYNSAFLFIFILLFNWNLFFFLNLSRTEYYFIRIVPIIFLLKRGKDYTDYRDTAWLQLFLEKVLAVTKRFGVYSPSIKDKLYWSQ